MSIANRLKSFRRLIEKVTVYEDKFTVEFKSGVTMDAEKKISNNLFASRKNVIVNMTY